MELLYFELYQLPENKRVYQTVALGRDNLATLLDNIRTGAEDNNQCLKQVNDDDKWEIINIDDSVWGYVIARPF